MDNSITVVSGKIVGLGLDTSAKSPKNTSSNEYIDIQSEDGGITRIKDIIFLSYTDGVVNPNTFSFNGKNDRILPVELHIFEARGKKFCIAARYSDVFFFNHIDFDDLKKGGLKYIAYCTQLLLLSLILSFIIIGIPFVLFYLYEIFQTIGMNSKLKSESVKSHLTAYGFYRPGKNDNKVTKEI